MDIASITSVPKACPQAQVILVMGSANETRRYLVTSSLIGWAHTHNTPMRHASSVFPWNPPNFNTIIIHCLWWQGSWGQHGAHMGPTGPRWAPCWPHELCYPGYFDECQSDWICIHQSTPDSKVHGSNMGPIRVLSAPSGPHVGPMNLAIRDARRDWHGSIMQGKVFEYTRPITTIFCTRHDSDTVVACAKYRCDRSHIFYTRVFWIFIEFRIRSNMLSGTGTRALYVSWWWPYTRAFVRVCHTPVFQTKEYQERLRNNV